MSKIRKNLKFILGIIVGFILGATAMVKAVSLVTSNDVSYQKNNGNEVNVKGALDELYQVLRTNNDTNKVYGVKRSISIASSGWERIEDSVGKVANATKDGSGVVNDFDNIYPWSEIRSYNYDTSTQSITAWYGESGFTFTPSDTTTEVLTYIPEFYYQRFQDGTYEYILISKDAKGGYSKSEAFSIGRYTMSGSSSRVHSRSGNSPLANTTITDFRTYARNLGIGFGQLDYHYFTLQLLYLVEYADYNSQEKLGLGNTSNTQAITSGGCDTLGMKSGTLNNDGQHSVIYRGVEDIFGNIWQFVDGINIKDNRAYINYNPSTYQADKFNGDYKMLGYINSSSTEYVSKLGYDANNPLISLAVETKGSATTYITDYFWQNTGNYVVVVGGGYAGLKSGLWCLSAGEPSSSATTRGGARLLKTT